MWQHGLQAFSFFKFTADLWLPSFFLTKNKLLTFSYFDNWGFMMAPLFNIFLPPVSPVLPLLDLLVGKGFWELRFLFLGFDSVNDMVPEFRQFFPFSTY